MYNRFVNLTAFRHALDVVRGKFDDPNHKGEVSHFQALTAALSGTVGVGNIAGVAVAVSLGGPGATFWMIVAGLLGMSSKFVECTLGTKVPSRESRRKCVWWTDVLPPRRIANQNKKGLGPSWRRCLPSPALAVRLAEETWSRSTRPRANSLP